MIVFNRDNWICKLGFENDKIKQLNKFNQFLCYSRRWNMGQRKTTGAFE